MSRFLAVLLAVLLAPAAFAQSPPVDNPAGPGWVGDEPNSAGGALPFCSPRDPWQEADPSCAYPADANGLGPARAASPGRILAVAFEHDLCLHQASACGVVEASLFAALGAPSTLTPGPGRWTAWSGTYHDVDADGWIDADEWTPGPVERIVAYVTPADHNERADPVNARYSNDTRDPDFAFAAVGDTGRYFAPSSNLDYVLLDGGILETMVIEAISTPVDVGAGRRSVAAGPDSLVEVDVYQAVDPTVEQLYAAVVVATLNAQGCDVEFTWLARACPTTTERTVATVVAAVVGPLDGNPVLQAVEDVASDGPRTGPIVGPVESRVDPPWPREGLDVDYGEPHLYLDQRLVAATDSVSGLAVSRESTTFTSSALGDGRHRPLAQSELHARLGVWQDVNGDGVIGTFVAPDPDDGCGADPHSCGQVADPNGYTPEESDGEFDPLCGAHQTDHGLAQGTYLAELTTPDGRWGTGVYVMTDRRDATDPAADQIDDDGRSQFNPYDDLVLDAEDGDVGDTLVTEGVIRVHMLCHDDSGVYAGYERLVFLDGTNRGYPVETTARVTATFAVDGVLRTETVEDVDAYAPFP